MASFTGGRIFDPNGHWRVEKWEQGITEGGSSGSGLFDAQNRIIGNLSGGNANINCTNRGDDNFYRLSVVWDSSNDEAKKLKPWLNPLDSNILTLDGKEMNGTPIRLSNRKEGEQLDGTVFPDGYPAGHNNAGITEYAERFSHPGQNKLYGVYFIPQKGFYSVNSPVKVQIYSGISAPENLLHEQIIKLTTSYYEKGSNSVFSEKELLYFGKKENYVRFATPVVVDSSFFVVFKLSPIQTTTDTFALYLFEREAEELNTAWFKGRSGWQLFTENPLLSRPVSLAVDVVLGFSGSDTVVTSPGRTKKTAIYPNPPKDGVLTIRFFTDEQPVQLRIFDSLGQLLQVENHLSFPYYILDTKQLGKGIYFLQVVYPRDTEVLKIIN